MSGKRQKIEYKVTIGDRNFSFVCGDGYHRTIANGDATKALENLKEPRTIKCADFKDDTQKFFDFITNSFVYDYNSIPQDASIVDQLTAECKLLYDYSNQLQECGLSFANLRQLDIDKELKDTVTRRSLCFAMEMYNICQNDIARTIFNDTFNTREGIINNSIEMATCSVLLAIGSTDRRVIDFLKRENFTTSKTVVDSMKNRWLDEDKNKYESRWLPSVKEEIFSEINENSIEDFEEIDNLNPMTDAEKKYLKERAGHGFVANGMEVTEKNTGDFVSREQQVMGTFLTPVNLMERVDYGLKQSTTVKTQ